MQKIKSNEMYITAIKRADREMNLGNGWIAKDRPHKNKKVYNRKHFKIEYQYGHKMEKFAL